MWLNFHAFFDSNTPRESASISHQLHLNSIMTIADTPRSFTGVIAAAGFWRQNQGPKHTSPSRCGTRDINYLSFIHSFTDWLTHWLTDSLTDSLTHSLTHSFIHLFINFFFFGGGGWVGGRDGDWLDLFTWPFRDILGRLTRSIAHCHRRREQNHLCAFIVPQWRCYRNFEPLVSHTNVHAGYGRSWRAFLKRFLVETILTMHTAEAKYQA